MSVSLISFESKKEALEGSFAAQPSYQNHSQLRKLKQTNAVNYAMRPPSQSFSDAQ
jgi:hypothetical protein